MCKSIIRASLVSAITSLTLVAGPAHAGAKFEKVDIVKEGIDLAPIVVKANANGYTSYATAGRSYMVRVFAKAKGASHVWFAGISKHSLSDPMEAGSSYFFEQKAPPGDDGWGVYKKSLKVHLGFNNTTWVTPPKQLCANNLAAEKAKGKSQASVLQKEWKLQTKAVIYFIAAADSKSNNKKGKHTPSSVGVGNDHVVYPVVVICKKGM